jgi:hypothetical protein
MGFFVPTIVLYHCTFFINSLTHMFGRVRYASNGVLLRVRFCECGGVLDVQSTGAASVPDVRSVQGRVRRGGKHDAIVEEKPRASLCRHVSV